MIFFIGKSYYQLASAHNKSNWGFAILGVATYYAGTFLFGILLAITLELMSPGTLEGMSDFLLGVIAVPFGLLSAAGLYYLLKRIWEANRDDAAEAMGPKES